MLKDSRNTGLLRLRHLREVNEATGETMAWQRERFAALADPAGAARVVSSFNLFQTPEALADRVASLAKLNGRTLEPSAGLGRIYRAVRYRSACPMILVDNSPDCCRELYAMTQADAAASLVQADFLTCDAERLGGRFDCVVMNPPFRMGTDIKHIRHALTLLNPGGRLVAICANGPRQRAALMPLVEAGGTWEDLPDGTFKGEVTSVRAALIVLNA